MSMDAQSINRIKGVNSFPSLLEFLRDDLDWPIASADLEDLTFEYEAAEFGLKPEFAPQVRKIYQLRPLATGQPWGIFFIDFENQQIPITLLRRILAGLVKKGRGRQVGKGWNAEDLLFMTTYGDEGAGTREVAFAHFRQQAGDLPILNVLQWDPLDTPAKLQDTYIKLRSNLGWPLDTSQSDAWRSQWAEPFRHRPGHVISTAKQLAEALAALSKKIRESCNLFLAAETEQGLLTKLYKAFQESLIHDLKPADFADTFAQTISYGLLTAAISRTDMTAGNKGTVLLAEDAAAMVPITNPFLKEVLETFLDVGGRKKAGMDFDELGVQDVVELLRGDATDLPAVLRDFGNKKKGEDPVIHFYEDYLRAYNKELKVSRGVFYTPQPVVSYIVRSVHELLQTEFGLEDGLASTITWGEMVAKNPGIKIPQLKDRDGKVIGHTDANSHFVSILDPATGTATFLIEVIDVIWKHLAARWERDRAGTIALLRTKSIPKTFEQFWNEYVPDHLLPRLFGYELMMAPYAIAHMKVGLKLGETGYRFGSDRRVRIYLTNALEPPSELQARLALDWEALAHEAMAVKAVKETQRFTVLIGNPPYSGNSANASKDESGTRNFIGKLVHDYYFVDGVPLGERNPKWLQDDYVKFLRLGQYMIQQTGVGTLGFITNHGYLDNPTFRGMRRSLMQSFDELRFLDLHGNSKKKEVAPDGSKDENVFDIMQGVAICLLVDNGESGRADGCKVSRADLHGVRLKKYAKLSEPQSNVDAWQSLAPNKPHYLLVHQFQGPRADYESGWMITDIMPLNNIGIISKRDSLAFQFERQSILDVVRDIFSLSVPEIVTKYPLSSWTSRDGRPEFVKESIGHFGVDEERIIQVLYRPFDCRWTYYTPKSKGFIAWPVYDVMRHMLAGPNIGLITSRLTKGEHFAHVQATAKISEVICMSSKTSNNGYIFPLFKYPTLQESAMGIGKEPNLSPVYVEALARAIGKKFMDRSALLAQELDAFSPEDVLHYVYAVLHSPTYRSRYSEFLRIDFPRIPLPVGPEVFDVLVPFGETLVNLHLLRHAKPAQWITRYAGPASPTVEKVSYVDGTVWLDKAQTSGFHGVPEATWNFHIGGYQVCEKWLKDRGPKKGKPGRTLSAEDIEHYQYIVFALTETQRVMREIDEAIEDHGGWPDAFQGKEHGG